MATITVKDAQSDLQQYLDRVSKGETLILTQGNMPVAELRPVKTAPVAERSVGGAKGTFEVPDAFFEPLPSELLDALNGRRP